MISKHTLHNLFFYDLEVVTEYQTIIELREEKPAFYKHWERIVSSYSEKWGDLDHQAAYEKYATLYPEFSKIISCAYGILVTDTDSPNGERKLNVRSISSKDEVEILTRFSFVVNKIHEMNKSAILCGHNIIEFDNPFFIKRCIKNNVKVPDLFANTIGVKPWDLQVLDTIKYWKFGGQRFTSLDLITCFLGLDSSKSEMDGSQVNSIYYSNEPNSLEKIAKYNEADVKALYDVVNHLSNL